MRFRRVKYVVLFWKLNNIEKGSTLTQVDTRNNVGKSTNGTFPIIISITSRGISRRKQRSKSGFSDFSDFSLAIVIAVVKEVGNEKPWREAIDIALM